MDMHKHLSCFMIHLWIVHTEKLNTVYYKKKLHLQSDHLKSFVIAKNLKAIINSILISLCSNLSYTVDLELCTVQQILFPLIKKLLVMLLNFHVMCVCIVTYRIKVSANE